MDTLFSNGFETSIVMIMDGYMMYNQRIGSTYKLVIRSLSNDGLTAIR